MRKFYSFLLILTAALCGFSNSAWGEELTVANSTAGSSVYFPVYGNFCDNYQHVQIIYSSSDLSAMSGSNITGITFYIKSAAAAAWTAAFQISLAEIADADFGDSTYPAPGFKSASLTTVYEGSLDATGSTLSIEFDTPFLYSGGNLLYDLKITTKGNYKDATFYAQAAVYTGAIYGVEGHNSSSLGSITSSNNQSRVYPKTTFTYESTTPVSCPKPTGFAYDNLTSSSVDLSWTAGGAEEEWNIQYKAADDADWTTVEGITDNPYTLDVLEPLTSYQVKVQAVCDVDDLSSFTSALSFTTPCAEEELPFSESFKNLTSGIPDCWDNSEGTTTNDSYKWCYFADGKTDHCVSFNSYNNSNGNTNFLYTPPIEVNTATKLHFWYKNPAGGDLTVYYSFDGGLTKNPLATGLTGKSSWTEATYSIPAPAVVKNLVVIFKGTSNYGSTGAYLYVDDISVYSSSCAQKVTSLSCSSVTAKSAVLSWTSTASEWWVRHRVGNGAWTIEKGVTSNPFTLTGLAPGKTHEVQVAAVCGEGSVGEWSSSITFTTLYGIPFDENFDGLASGIPSGWNNTDGTVTTTSYRWNYHATGRDGHCVRFNSYNTTNDQYNKLKTPQIYVDNSAKFSFYYKNPTGGDFSVYYKVDNGAETALTGMTGLTGISGWTYKEVTLPGACVGHNVTIVFKGTSNYGSGDAYIYLDDVKIEGIMDCGQPEEVTASAETNSTAHVAWTARAGITSYQYCVVARDAAPDWSGNLTTATNSVDLTGLTASTNYDFYVRCVCGVGEYSDVSDVCQFSTTAGCPTPSGVSFSNQTHNSATVTWTAGGSEAAWNLRYKAGSGECTTPVRLTSRTYNLTGLTTGTTYTVEVQADCDGTWASSTYTPTCPSLGEISKSAMTACGVTLSWSAGGSETGWNVHYKAGAGAYGDPIHVTSPTYTLTGLTTGTTYYYQVRADCGGDWTTEASYTPVCPVPGKPTLSNQTYNSVRVSWTAGNCEDSWNLRYKKGEDEWTVVSDLTSRTYDATGLVAGNEYTFQVQAGCEGTWSASSTYTPECPQPGDITLTNQKYDRVTVGWAKGGTEDAWRLRYKAADGDWIVKEANTASNSGHVIDGLTSGVTYTIEVTASCCAGGSARTTTYTPSCAQPGAITLSNRTHSSAQVAWAASGTLDRWNLQYKVASAEDVPANWTNVVMNTASRSGHTISGLTTDVTYTIRVTAACCSADPQDIEYTPVCATPASASVTNIRDVQASASWSAVSGSGITTFQYIVVARDATPDWSEATTVSATSATLTGLSVATNYDFYVRSKCADGNYSESLKRQFATTAQQPTSIVVDELDYDGLGATLSWSKSTYGAETQYQWKTSKAGSDWSEPTTTRTVHVTGLSEHTTYTFYVRSYYNETVQSSAVTRSFTTDYGLNAVPWSHDFESDATGSGQIPAGWNSKTYGSYTIYPYVVANGYSTYSYAGSKCLYFSGGSSSSQQSIILPKFDRDLKELTISFYYNNGTTDTDYPTFEIGYYATDGNPSTAFTAIAEIPLSDGYTLAEINLQDFPTTHKRLVISYSNGDLSHSAYIDDINVFETPNCQRPVSPTCTATTSSSATLAWTENGAATAWEIEYSTHSDFSSPSTIIAAATNPFTLSDLNQNTQYYARVRGVCDEEDKSEWSTTSASFRTACGSYLEYDLPYSTGFETETETGSGNIPYCWSSITYTYNDYYGGSTVYPYVTTSGGRSGNCLQFYGGVTGTSVQYVTLPLFENELKDLTLEFYQKGNSSSSYAQFTVGYFTTLGDASTFTVVKNIDRATDYTKVSVDFSSVPADMHNIAIRWGGGSYAAFGYIEDVRVTTKDNIFTGAANDGLWSSARNWTHGAVPMLSEDVVITKPVTISSATNAKAKSVTLDQTDTNTGAIDIAPAGELVISGTLRKATGTAESKIYSPTAENDVNIGSSADGLGGLVIGSHATANGLNDATVNFYSLSHGASGSTASVSQYLGTPFSNLPKMLCQFYNSWVYKFTNTGTPSWERVNGDDGLEAFAGYAVISADPVGHTYWMQGTLVASENQNISLQFNSGDGSNPDNENMLANSWMAPIQIRAFNAATDFTNADATIYIFNSGSPDDYETNNGASTTGALAGQYSAYTPGTAAATDVIPAMQSFSVYTSAPEASIALDYNRLVYVPAVAGLAITPNRAPRRTGTDAYEAGEPAKMRLFVNAASGYGDMLYMLEREDFSEDFENGWDARKMFGESVAPQLYAITPDGNMAINCVPTFEGTILGFRKGANDNGYTFTFDYDGADSWYLLDLKEQVSTLITTNSSYMFVAAADDLAARFIISRTPLNYTDGVATGVDNHTTSTASQKLLIDGVLYIIRNGRIYSAEGALLK